MKPPETLTEADIDRLLYWLRTDQSYNRTYYQRFRDYLIGSLMADAGLRVSEVVNLRPHHLLQPNVNTPSDNTLSNLPLHTLHIPAVNSKTNHARTIPLTDRIMQAITMHFQYFNPRFKIPYTTFVFPSGRHNKHMTTRQVQRIINRAAENALHRPVNPHLLRHTFATRIVRASNTSVAQQLLGHKALSSTQRYLHPNADDLTTAVSTLNKPKGTTP